MIRHEFHCMNLVFKKFRALRAKNEELGHIYNPNISRYQRSYMESKLRDNLLKELDNLKEWVVSLTLPRHDRNIRQIFGDIAQLRRTALQIGETLALNPKNSTLLDRRHLLRQIRWPIPD